MWWHWKKKNLQGQVVEEFWLNCSITHRQIPEQLNSQQHRCEKKKLNSALFECSRGSTACPSEKSSVNMKSSMQHWWSDTDGEKTVIGETLIPAPHCPPHTSHGLAWDRTWASVTSGATNRLSHCKIFLPFQPKILTYI